MIRRISTLFLIFCVLQSQLLFAAAPNPTIINGNVILCPPNGQETLITQLYDSYQWYKDGNAIPGATQQTHVVNFFEDAGSLFSVFVTLGGQSAMSPTILVDGYAFLPLVVMSYGQGYWFTPDVGFQLCYDDELFFEIMLPYDTNLQWYRDFIPIPGANQPIFQVDQTGVYTASGAPSLCPQFIQFSMELPVIMHDPPLPVITQSNDTLFTSEYPGQWYAGILPIFGATGPFYIPEATGLYSFRYTDLHGCSKLSEPFYYELLGINSPEASYEHSLATSRGQLSVSCRLLGFNYRIFDLSGSLLRSGIVTGSTIDFSMLNMGFYLIRFEHPATIKVMKISHFGQ